MSENTTVNLNVLCNSCAKMVCCLSVLSFTFLYAGSSTQNAIRLVSFGNFVRHPTHKQKANEECAPDSNSSIFDNHSELDTCSYENFFLTMTYFTTSQNIYPLPETPCMYKVCVDFIISQFIYVVMWVYITWEE